MLKICAYGFENTGAGCFPEIGSILMDVLVPLRDSTGVLNFMDLADAPFDEAYFAAKVNHADPSKRWYPLLPYKNPTDVRSESLTQTFDDGTTVIIEQGPRIAMVKIIGKQASPIYHGKLESFQHDEFGVYRIDIFGNWIGQKIDDNDYLYPIPMDHNSFDPVWNPGTSKDKQNITLKMVYAKSVKDKNISMVAAEELDFDVSYLRGLLSVSPVYSNLNNSPGTLTVELNTDFKTLGTTQRVVGLLIGDFVLEDMTVPSAPVAIAITTSIEQTDAQGNGTGIYDMTFPNQAPNCPVRLRPTKAGFDFAAVKAKIAILV